MQIKILDGNLIPPRPSTSGSAGLDLQAILDDVMILEPGKTVKVRTGIAIYIGDKNVVGLIHPRSGFGSMGLVLGNLTGIIDSDYQGEIHLILWNRSNEEIEIFPYDKVAQLIFTPVVIPNFEVVKYFTRQTDRGGSGFGSTGRGSEYNSSYRKG